MTVHTTRNGISSDPCCQQPTFHEVCRRLRENELSSLDMVAQLENFNWEVISQSLENCTKLTWLNLADNDLMVNELRLPANIVSLNLSGNRLKRIEFVSALPNLEMLDLSHNGFDSFDVPKLCQLLQKCPKLTVLRLANNDIGRQGLIQLCETLCNLKSLEHLDLTGNFGGHSAYHHLVRLVENNHSIRELYGDFAPTTELKFRLEMNCFARQCIQDYKSNAWSDTLAKATELDTIFTIVRERPDMLDFAR